MTEIVWDARPAPAPSPADAVLLHAAPSDVGELAPLRLRLRKAVAETHRSGVVTREAVDQLLLVLEEMVSNGLRHGRRPVVVTVTADDGGWLLQVSDAAGDRPPAPAVGRDAAQGGLGLILVARLAGAHGWAADGRGGKTVWACVGHAVETFGAALPEPRAEVTRAEVTRGDPVF